MAPKSNRSNSVAWKVLVFRDGTQFGTMGPYLGPSGEKDARADAKELLRARAPGVSAKVIKTHWNPGETRKFDGKTYSLWSRILYKSMAESVARRLREEDGRSARVTKAVGEFKVWRGPKLKRNPSAVIRYAQNLNPHPGTTAAQVDAAYFDLVEADEQNFGPVPVEHFGTYGGQGLVSLDAYATLSDAGLAERTDHTEPGKSAHLFPDGVHMYSTFELTELGRRWAAAGDFEGDALTGSEILHRMGSDGRRPNAGVPRRKNHHLKVGERAKYSANLTDHHPRLRGARMTVVEVLDDGYLVLVDGYEHKRPSRVGDRDVVSADSTTLRWPGNRYEGIDPLENPDWKALAQKAKELADSAVSAGKDGATRIKEEAQLVGAKARIAKVKSELAALEKCAKSLGNVHRPAIPDRYEIETEEGKQHLVPGITEFSLMGGLPQDYTPGKKEGYEGLFEKREQLVDAETTLAQIKEAVAQARRDRK